MTNLGSPRDSAWQRGNQLSKSLGNFYTLSYVAAFFSLLLSVGGLWVMLETIGRNAGFLTYGLGGLGILIFVGIMALYLRGLRSAREAVAAVTQYAGDGRSLNSALVTNFVSWLNAWQWLMIISGVLGAVLGMVSGTLNGLLAGMGGSDDLGGLGAAVGVLSGLGSVVRSAIQTVLGWLVLAAVKGFFTAVLQRAVTQSGAVMPAAQKAGTWLTFTLVVMVLMALLSVFIYLGIAVGILLPFLAGEEKTKVPLFLPLLALLPLVLTAVMQIWQIVLIARSNGFAKDVAATLDGESGMGGPAIADPWNNAVIEP